jgi:hypothetical protein
MHPRPADNTAPSGLLGVRVEIARRTALALAALVLAVGSISSYYSLFHYRPGGGMFPGVVAPIILVLYLIGAVVALRFKTLGGLACVGVTAAATPMLFHHLIGWQAGLAIVGLGLPALLWLMIGLHRQGRLVSAAAVVLAVAGAAIGFGLVNDYYNEQWGPQHPESDAVLLPSDVMWIWSGGITTDQALVKAKMEGGDDVRLAYSAAADLSAASFVDPAVTTGDVVTFALTGLEPDTEYHYAVEVDGELDQHRTGRFSTFPDGPASFTLALGGCARTGSNGVVFETIAGHNPLVYLISGDFFYGDIPDNNIDRFEEAFDVTLTAPAQSELYRSTGIAYVWDDHDFGPNNSTSASDSREAALAGYRRFVPSYPLADSTSPIYQAFTVGRARVIMLDSRSARIQDETMLGAEQKAWLIEELVESAKTHAVVLLLSPNPWIGESGSDYWAEFADERSELAQAIADNNIENLVMLSGDAHMVALDDGSNTNYSTKPGPAFPILHAAALDRPGSTRGGPFSHGRFAGTGQFGLITVLDDGDDVSVVLEGRTWEDEILTSLTFEPTLPATLGS